MSTTHTIGTAQFYASVTDWDGGWTTGGWIGQLNNQEFVVAVKQVIANHSPGSAADFTRLECQTGMSFKDNAGKLSNALRYNASNGAAIRMTANYDPAIETDNPFTTLLGLQVASTGNGETAVKVVGATSVVDQCIIEGSGAGGTLGTLWIGPATSIGRNTLVVSRNGEAGVLNSYGAALEVMTIVTPSDVTSTDVAIKLNSAASIINCAGYGHTAFLSGGTPSGSNNSSDQTIGFGSTNQASKTYANQFENTTNAARDFRIKSTGTPDLKNNGTTDASLPSAIDIVGTTRPQGVAWDIGAWELVAAAPSSPVPVVFPQMPIPSRSYSVTAY